MFFEYAHNFDSPKGVVEAELSHDFGRGLEPVQMQWTVNGLIFLATIATSKLLQKNVWLIVIELLLHILVLILQCSLRGLLYWSWVAQVVYKHLLYMWFGPSQQKLYIARYCHQSNEVEPHQHIHASSLHR